MRLAPGPSGESQAPSLQSRTRVLSLSTRPSWRLSCRVGLRDRCSEQVAGTSTCT